MKTLLILNHAPDYRESFLRELSKKVELTVVAQPCEQDRLTPPGKRGSYRYVEIPSKRFLGIQWQKDINKHLHFNDYDVVCCNLNPRQIPWILHFLKNKKLQQKWIWWGPFIGQSNARPIRMLKNNVIAKAAACLTYSEPIAGQLTQEHGVYALSFNNTEIMAGEFVDGSFDKHPEIRLLFVGRWQPRKRLERLIELANRREDVHVRLIGPGMENLTVNPSLTDSGRCSIIGRAVGKELIPHFHWADMVANPGHAGLLVMNAARHGKGIVIDAESNHAPEYWLAKEAGQPFIPFAEHSAVDHFIDSINNDRSLLTKWAAQLQNIAREKYTVEHMAEAHLQVFNHILKSKKE